MNIVEPQRILIVDDNPIVRETLAQWLRRDGHEVETAETGMRAFLALRDFSRAIGWLYTRAALSGLIDGWILADAYHERHADRPVILACAAARLSSQGNLVLNQPTPRAVFDALRQALAFERTPALAAAPSDARKAA